MQITKTKTLTPTLFIYLAKRFLASVFFTTITLLGIVSLLDFMELTRRLGAKNIDAGPVALEMLLLKMPDQLLQLTPFAILIGTLLCFSKLTKDHELIVIRASGVPARNFLISPLIVCMTIGLFNLFTLNPFASTTLKSYQKLEAEIFPGSIQGFLTNGGQVWLRQDDETENLLIFAKNIADNGRRLEEATVFVNDKDGHFIKRIDTPNMRLRTDKWLLDTPLILKPGQPSERSKSMELNTVLTPETIRNSFTSPQTLSVWELKNFIDKLQDTGFPTQSHEMQWQKLISSPALILAMFLIAAPFALQFSRNQGMARMLMVGVGFGFAFYFFTNFISNYGMAGRIDITLAAWLPTLIAGFLGLSLFLHFREE
ncbi:MAG: lipopolysaccharide export system permease protein [Alphaproteobacteria bacterium]|jgi:lipopolysaccharide export system permease protein